METLQIPKKLHGVIAKVMLDVITVDNIIHQEEKEYFLEFLHKHPEITPDFVLTNLNEKVFQELSKLSLVEKESIANHICSIARTDGHFCQKEYDYIYKFFGYLNFRYSDLDDYVDFSN